jgi:hypothetical protein
VSRKGVGLVVAPLQAVNVIEIIIVFLLISEESARESP